MSWKAYGDAGFAARISHCVNLAKYFEDKIIASDGIFTLSHPRNFVNVCFWWMPAALRPFNPAKATQQDLDTLDKVAPGIKSAMQQAGDAMIGFQPLNGLPNFFRIVFSNAATVTAAGLDALLNKIDGYGKSTTF
ncbi:hypothetical protein WJX84_005934 [Apatococcus fuscideae]|uniref:Aspartate aminotransferase family protein n=1 Tax=Apatococcus fuscideae TaxID=2026836 RepID=A0AAW1SYT3_9CHLO